MLAPKKKRNQSVTLTSTTFDRTSTLTIECQTGLAAPNPQHGLATWLFFGKMQEMPLNCDRNPSQHMGKSLPIKLLPSDLPHAEGNRGWCLIVDATQLDLTVRKALSRKELKASPVSATGKSNYIVNTGQKTVSGILSFWHLTGKVNNALTLIPQKPL